VFLSFEASARNVVGYLRHSLMIETGEVCWAGDAMAWPRVVRPVHCTIVNFPATDPPRTRIAGLVRGARALMLLTAI
jgi:hypothetical protein